MIKINKMLLICNTFVNVNVKAEEKAVFTVSANMEISLCVYEQVCVFFAVCLEALLQMCSVA